MLRDFVPCIGSDGKAGLYDSVSERIFKSSTDYDLATQVGLCTNAADVLTFSADAGAGRGAFSMGVASAQKRTESKCSVRITKNSQLASYS